MGHAFSAQASSDGKAWTEVGGANITMPRSVLIGLAVNAHSKCAINLWTFDNAALRTTP